VDAWMNIRKVFIKMKKDTELFVALYIGAQRKHFSRVLFVTV